MKASRYLPSEYPEDEPIPRRLEPGEKLVECPICESYHPQSFNGDCRDRYNRFPPPDNPEDEAEFFDEDDPRREDDPTV